MEKSKYKLTSKVLLQDNDDKLHFATIDKETSHEIRESFKNNNRRFNIISVIATVKTTTWVTLLTLEEESGTYLLPLKLGVRNKEGLKVGEEFSFTLQIKDFIPPQADPDQETTAE